MQLLPRANNLYVRPWVRATTSVTHCGRLCWRSTVNRVRGNVINCLLTIRLSVDERARRHQLAIHERIFWWVQSIELNLRDLVRETESFVVSTNVKIKIHSLLMTKSFNGLNPPVNKQFSNEFGPSYQILWSFSLFQTMFYDSRIWITRFMFHFVLNPIYVRMTSISIEILITSM